MIHHVSVAVEDLERSGRFYDSVLGALGWRRQVETEEAIGWGIVRPIFFASARPGGAGGRARLLRGKRHLRRSRAAWEGGVGAGGTDEGAPGPRPEYGGSYYSAYLRDPDGNRIEIAVGSQLKSS